MDKIAANVMEQIKKYMVFVNRQYPVERVILFGSYAKGTAGPESDIDVAIVSANLGKAHLKEKLNLYGLRYYAQTTDDLQPFPFGTEEFENSDHFFIQEIKKTGVDITQDVL